MAAVQLEPAATWSRSQPEGIKEHAGDTLKDHRGPGWGPRCPHVSFQIPTRNGELQSVLLFDLSAPIAIPQIHVTRVPSLQLGPAVAMLVIRD